MSSFSLRVPEQEFQGNSTGRTYGRARIAARDIVRALCENPTRLAIKKREAQKKEAAYQSALSEYQRALRPGITRKEAEDYLRAKNANFTQMCCVEPNDLAKRHTWDDLVKIGEEEHPWFCSEHYVYVAFQFADHVQIENGYSMKDDDSDVLKTVSIFHQLGGCL